MKKKFILMFMIALAMGMTACSSESKGDSVSVETDSRQETDNEETTDTKTTAGKGCYVSVTNQDFYSEEQQKKIEGCFNDAIEIALMSGIPLDKLISLLTLLYEEN